MTRLRYAYYPGCASQSITKEADLTTKQVAELLGIELVDMPAANCCGAGLLKDYNLELHLTLNARIFTQAENMGLDILTICSTCFMTMNTARKELEESPQLLEKTNRVLRETTGAEYTGRVRVNHLLWALRDDYGFERLKREVKNPLSHLRIAPFYGCHILRPSGALGFEDPREPASLEGLIDVVGASAVDYEGRTLCCGFQADLVNPDTAIKMTARRLEEAKMSEADCLLTPCPFCHINLDSYQEMAEKKVQKKFTLPVFHLAQVVGLSLGLAPEDMGLHRHLISAEEIL